MKLDNKQYEPSKEEPEMYSDDWWYNIIESWRKSELTMADFCRNENLSYDKFWSMRSKLFPKEVINAQNISEWSSITIDSTVASFDLEIQDLTIKIYKDFDQELLKELLEVIRDEH